MTNRESLKSNPTFSQKKRKWRRGNAFLERNPIWGEKLQMTKLFENPKLLREIQRRTRLRGARQKRKH